VILKIDENLRVTFLPRRRAAGRRCRGRPGGRRDEDEGAVVNEETSTVFRSTASGSTSSRCSRQFVLAVPFARCAPRLQGLCPAVRIDRIQQFAPASRRSIAAPPLKGLKIPS